MTTEEIIQYMRGEGWSFEEHISNASHTPLTVAFSCEDWHGIELKRPVIVSKLGVRDIRDDLITEAGREAWKLWKEFPRSVPPEYFNPDSRVIEWRVSKEEN